MLTVSGRLRSSAFHLPRHFCTAPSGFWAQDAPAAQPAHQHMPQPPEIAPAQTDGLGAADGRASGRVDDTNAAAPAQGNVLPWRRRVPSPPRGQQQQGADSRIVLLFDLNGTLTSHTSKRRSAGINRMRPGLLHLQRLQVCSCAQMPTSPSGCHPVRACHPHYSSSSGMMLTMHRPDCRVCFGSGSSAPHLIAQ